MIKLVTDSSCYLPPDFINRHKIGIVPLNVHFGEAETFEESRTITNAEFYRRLQVDPVHPTTSQPSVGAFLAAYQSTNGYSVDEVLAITVSSRLSGTFNAARTAAMLMPQRSVTVFDSRCIALGTGLMVAAAADMIAAGYLVAEILPRLEQMRREIQIFFTLDTLEYLHRGGRIGRAAVFVGTALKLKPILTIKDGVLYPLDKVRTRSRVKEAMLGYLQVAVADPQMPVYLGAMHAGAFVEMNELVSRMRSVYNNVSHLITGEVGPSLGVHGGPGILGIGVCPVPAFNV